jgi:hypothetical protein
MQGAIEMEDNREGYPKGFLWQLIIAIFVTALATLITWGDYVWQSFTRLRRKLRSVQSHN